jgi:hypothetical protein
MPVELEWHPSLPVLVATYKGTLSAKEYDKMCDERAKMLKAGPSQVILFADTRQMQAFPDAEIAVQRESVMRHGKVVRTLVVLDDRLYRRIRRSLLDDKADGFPVSFYADPDQALVDAQTLAQQLG